MGQTIRCGECFSEPFPERDVDIAELFGKYCPTCNIQDSNEKSVFCHICGSKLLSEEGRTGTEVIVQELYQEGLVPYNDTRIRNVRSTSRAKVPEDGDFDDKNGEGYGGAQYCEMENDDDSSSESDNALEAGAQLEDAYRTQILFDGSEAEYSEHTNRSRVRSSSDPREQHNFRADALQAISSTLQSGAIWGPDNSPEPAALPSVPTASVTIARQLEYQYGAACDYEENFNDRQVHSMGEERMDSDENQLQDDVSYESIISLFESTQIEHVRSGPISADMTSAEVKHNEVDINTPPRQKRQQSLGGGVIPESVFIERECIRDSVWQQGRKWVIGSDGTTVDLEEFLGIEGLDMNFFDKLKTHAGIMDIDDLMVASPEEIDDLCLSMNLTLGEKLRFRRAIQQRQQIMHFENYEALFEEEEKALGMDMKVMSAPMPVTHNVAFAMCAVAPNPARSKSPMDSFDFNQPKALPDRRHTIAMIPMH